MNFDEYNQNKKHLAKDGGQAFPLSYEGLQTFGNPTGKHAEPGMTLRDHFAGEALNGMLSCHRDPVKHTSDYRGELDAGRVARRAYVYADAMLAARSEGGAA